MEQKTNQDNQARNRSTYLVRRVRRRDGDGDDAEQDQQEAAGRRHGLGRHFQLLLVGIRSQVAKQFIRLFHVFSVSSACQRVSYLS